jgi:hypothetical protein
MKPVVLTPQMKKDAAVGFVFVVTVITALVLMSVWLG